MITFSQLADNIATNRYHKCKDLCIIFSLKWSLLPFQIEVIFTKNAWSSIITLKERQISTLSFNGLKLLLRQKKAKFTAASKGRGNYFEIEEQSFVTRLFNWAQRINLKRGLLTLWTPSINLHQHNCLYPLPFALSLCPSFKVSCFEVVHLFGCYTKDHWKLSSGLWLYVQIFHLINWFKIFFIYFKFPIFRLVHKFSNMKQHPTIKTNF